MIFENKNGLTLRVLILSFTVTEIGFAQTVYLVVKKDTLSNIIYEKYGSPLYGPNGRLKKIISFNPQIRDPHRIMPGDFIFIPDDYVEITKINPPEVKHPEIVRAPSSIQNDETQEIGKAFFMAGTGGMEIQQYDKERKLTSRVVTSSAYSYSLGMDQAWSENSHFNLKWDLTKAEFEQPQGARLEESEFLLSKFSGTYFHKISSNFKFGLKTEFAQLPHLALNDTTSVKIETPWVPIVSPALTYSHRLNRHYEAGLEGSAGYVFPAVISSSETYSGYGYEMKPYLALTLKKMQIWTEASWSERNFSNSQSDIKVQEMKFMFGIRIPIMGD